MYLSRESRGDAPVKVDKGIIDCYEGWDYHAHMKGVWSWCRLVQIDRQVQLQSVQLRQILVLLEHAAHDS